MGMKRAIEAGVPGHEGADKVVLPFPAQQQAEQLTRAALGLCEASRRERREWKKGVWIRNGKGLTVCEGRQGVI